MENFPTFVQVTKATKLVEFLTACIFGAENIHFIGFSDKLLDKETLAFYCSVCLRNKHQIENYTFFSSLHNVFYSVFLLFSQEHNWVDDDEYSLIQ